MDKQYEGIINLRSGHSVLVGNIPTKITTKDLAEREIFGNNDMEKFGFFETSTPNYATYYPDATPEDFQPKDEEFIYPVFRMLSEVIVSKGRPIDFSKPGVLKKSMNKLIGQTINIDHETALGNAIGSVAEVYWQNSYVAKDGTKVPAGFNAKMKIDAKSNPRIARGIQMTPPSIHSNSVTVRFSWVPSHKFESLSEFYDALGTYHKDGQLVRCIVDNIISYNETSLVSHGADAFAQKIGDDGEIVNPGYANSTYQFSADKPINTVFSTDYKDWVNPEGEDMAILSLSNSENINNFNQDNLTGMKELLAELIANFGFDAATTEASLSEAIKTQLTSLKDTNATLTQDAATQAQTISTLTSEKEALETEKETLTSENATLKQNEETVGKLTTSTRNEALRYAKLSMGDKLDPSIINLIANADINTAGALLKQYRSSSEEKFKATCKKCGSTEVSRNSAIPGADGIINDDNNGGEPTSKSFAEARANLQNKHKKTSRFFNNDNNEKK